MPIHTTQVKRAWDFTATGSGLNTVLFTYDVRLYDSLCFQLSGTFVGTVLLEGANDIAGPWLPLPTLQLNVAAAGPIITGYTAPGIYGGNLPTIFVRARLSAWTSGAVTLSAIAEHGVLSFTTENVVGTSTLLAGSALAGAFAPGASATVGTGTLSYNFRSAASTNVALILTGSRKLYGYSFYNPSATAAVVKFYNKATAPVVATDVPVFVVPLPATSERRYWNVCGKQGFNLGLGIACTGLIANTDATPTAVDQIIGHVDYI